MNIFVLDKDPWKIPSHYCDLHVNKMLLESCQMLCNVFSDAPYRKTHINHPCSVWVRQNTSNWQWLLSLANALSAEYTKRTGKIHGCDKIVDWLNNQDETELLSTGELTPWPQCMPEEYKKEALRGYEGMYLEVLRRCKPNQVFEKAASIFAYRRYYADKLREFRKRGMCKFTRGI